jgi:hypothetical protein
MDTWHMLSCRSLDFTPPNIVDDSGNPYLGNGQKYPSTKLRMIGPIPVAKLDSNGTNSNQAKKANND